MLKLNFNNHREYHWTPFGLYEQERAEAFADVVADMREIDRMHVFCRFFDDAAYKMPRLRKQFVRVFKVNKSAGNYIRGASHLAALRVNYGDDDEYPVL